MRGEDEAADGLSADLPQGGVAAFVAGQVDAGELDLVEAEAPPPPDSDQHDDRGRAIPEPVSETDARLAYVAVTRARRRLDLGGLAWIDDFPVASEPS